LSRKAPRQPEEATFMCVMLGIITSASLLGKAWSNPPAGWAIRWMAGFHEAIATTEASIRGLLACVGVIDRSSYSSIDFGVVGRMTLRFPQTLAYIQLRTILRAAGNFGC
jgi:hypothetical protein